MSMRRKGAVVVVVILAAVAFTGVAFAFDVTSSGSTISASPSAMTSTVELTMPAFKVGEAMTDLKGVAATPPGHSLILGGFKEGVHELAPYPQLGIKSKSK